MKKRILVFTENVSTNFFFSQHFCDTYHLSIHEDLSLIGLNDIKTGIDYIFIDIFFFNKLNKDSLTKERFNEVYLPLCEQYPEAHLVIMADRCHIQDCVLAIKLGIDSYTNYPLVADEIQYVMDLISERDKNEAHIEYLEAKVTKPLSKQLLNSQSDKMLATIEKIKSVAKTDTTVLLTGESGTGKSVLAKKIHQLSNRKKGQFISVHCGALSEGLIESELFGHEKGSFTGAVNKKLGKFELANGGTLFLDEIGTISETTQIRLLQVLQERFIQRVGGEENIEINIRVIAATNANLKEFVEKKLFRSDLYYRLNVFQIEVPSLKDRLEDIEVLAQNFLNRFNQRYGKNILSIDSDVLENLNNYSWPGNIRELENLIERAYVLEMSSRLTSSHLLLDTNDNSSPSPSNEARPSQTKSFGSLTLTDARRMTLDAFEKRYIVKILNETHGELREAAAISGVSIRQLQKFISKHHIDRKKFLVTHQTDLFL